MRETWYEVNRYNFYNDPAQWIKPLIVVKETEKTIWIEENDRVSGYAFQQRKNDNIFRTKAEAETEVTLRLSKEVEQAHHELDEAKASLSKWFGRE